MSFITDGAFSLSIVARVEPGGSDDHQLGYQAGEKAIECLRCGEDNLPILRCDNSNGNFLMIDLCKTCILELFEAYEESQKRDETTVSDQ